MITRLVPEPVRTAVEVRAGMSAIGEHPATCIPWPAGGQPIYCYLTAEQAESFEEDDIPQKWWAEWNGVSYDLIEPMTDAEIFEAGEANDNEAPL